MSRQFPVTMRGVCALAMAALLPIAGAVWAPQAQATPVQLEDAEFRWALNKQSSGRSHGPGLNFLAAGDISDAITGPNTAIAPADWKATAGDVSIEKRSANGDVSPATWAGVQTDQSGKALSSSSSKYSGLEMVFTGGKGTVDPAAGTARIEWDGTVSVLYYSGFVYLTISDPVLTVNGNTATVAATLGGHQTDRSDSSVWTKLAPKSVTLANYDSGAVSVKGDKGFSASPKYSGVRYPRADSSQPQTTSGANWGAFPESFVDYARDSGSGAFWYSTGGVSDASKVPSPTVISWDSADPFVPSNYGGGAPGDSGNSGESDGIVKEVIQDSVDDIIRAAGADVVGTAEAWMDEAWSQAQPVAVKAAQAAAAGPSADAGTGDSGMVVEDEFTEAYVETYTASAPMTAGTVGSTLATITLPAASAPAPAAAPAAAPQTATPVAANLPLTEVAYAQTSASSETGNPAHQWQWWAGLALLAIAAVVFVQTVRRKD